VDTISLISLSLVAITALPPALVHFALPCHVASIVARVAIFDIDNIIQNNKRGG